MRTTLIQLRYHPAFRCGRFYGAVVTEGRGGESEEWNTEASGGGSERSAH